jgi:hypothetical protein
VALGIRPLVEVHRDTRLHRRSCPFAGAVTAE